MVIMKETTIKAYFWNGSGYNAVIFTDGNRWICFDETFEGIDLYEENAVDLCKERIEVGDFNYFDDMYAEFSPATGYVGNMSPAVGENFDDEFPVDEITYLGIVEE